MTAFNLEVTSNPEVEAKLLAEIVEVVGDGDVRWEHLPRLKYLTCCQKETLRLHPPAPAFLRIPKKDMLLGGKWAVQRTSVLMLPSSKRSILRYPGDASSKLKLSVLLHVHLQAKISSNKIILIKKETMK
jgi:cytochrome P450/NADPH-cytochrome P450 reductase